jgi:FtsP/CotA-like multicopper oxidase with cupredoxin domain
MRAMTHIHVCCHAHVQRRVHRPRGATDVASGFGSEMEVEPRQYRLRLLNGSDSRSYVLKFRDSITQVFWALWSWMR